MEQILFTLVLAAGFFALLASGLWVSLSLLGAGLIGFWLFTGAPAGPIMATATWGAANSWALAALPLFIWMGEILARSRLSDDLFAGLAPWLDRLPGRLLHVNILGSAIFAASSGSSAATAATIGRMTLPELARRGYDRQMAIGTLAGSATLGLLIPPSIILIVYGVATEQSIARLFVAGIGPGLLLVALFAGYVMAWAAVHPDAAPPSGEAADWPTRLRALRRLGPILALVSAVIGSIYLGLASPTDAAAVGVAMALVLSWRAGSLSRTGFTDGLLAATRTACMIAFLLAGAAFLTVAMGYAGIPAALAGWIGSLGLSPPMLLAALTLFFVVVGCFLDGISMVVLTTSVILPLVEQAGIDLIWFGIYLVLVVEMSQITPPVGFNLFVIQGLTGDRLLAIARAGLPFFLLLAVAIAIIVALPDIATYLPSHMAR